MHKALLRESIQRQISLSQEKVSLDSSVIDKVVALRMNKSFMIFVQNNKHRDNINFIAGLDEIVETDEEVQY